MSAVISVSKNSNSYSLINSKSQIFPSSILPELQKIILRLAFSSLCNITDTKKGFEVDPNEDFEELYHKIQLCESLVQFEELIYTTNKLFLETYLLGQLKEEISHSLPMKNLTQPPQKHQEVPYLSKLESITKSETQLKDKLKELGNFKALTATGSPIPCLPFLKPSPAALLIRFTTDQHVKNFALAHWMRSVTDTASPFLGWTQETETRLSVLAIEAGANPNFFWHGSYPIHRCANPYILQALIKSGASINAQAKGMHDNNTPLHCLVRYPKVVSVLCATAGIELDARNSRNETPLIRATLGRYWESAKLLIKAGANIHARDEKQKSALDYVSDYLKSMKATDSSVQKAAKVAQLMQQK